jgi:hypothetical protein
MTALPPEPDTVIVLAADQASFYHFVKPRQEAGGRTLVVLDRRTADRRGKRASGKTPAERRSKNRRKPTPEAALALMSVLGFMVLHRNGDGWQT